MNKKLLLSLFLVLLFALKAEASDWVRIDLETKEENTDKIFIDLENLHSEGKVITYWDKYLYQDNSSIICKISVNCEKKEYQLLYIIKYNNKDELISTELPSKKWLPIPPDSYPDTFHSLLCKDGMPRPSNELANLKDLRKVFLELLSETQNTKSDEKK